MIVAMTNNKDILWFIILFQKRPVPLTMPQRINVQFLLCYDWWSGHEFMLSRII